MGQRLLTRWIFVLADAASSQKHAVSPAHYCQAFFVLAAAAILAMNVLPNGTRRYLFDYGAREVKQSSSPKRAAAAATTPTAIVADAAGAGKTATAGETATTTVVISATLTRYRAAGAAAAAAATEILESVVAAVVTRSQVPHAWFASFYLGYLVFALGWAVQWWFWLRQQRHLAESAALVQAEPKLSSTTNVFGWLMASQQRASAPSMSLVQVYLAFGLEILQAVRRLYEHLFVFKPSRSKINVSHWLLGMAYYLCISVAIWIEGSDAIWADGSQQRSSLLSRPADLPITVYAKLATGTLIYSLAWYGQYTCHVHLASLKKYSLPRKGLFAHLVCPHYTCEALLYLALSLLAAPEGRLFNRTLLSSVGFVLAVLGVTADRTKAFYISKFGTEPVAKKWRIVPFVF